MPKTQQFSTAAAQLDEVATQLELSEAFAQNAKFLASAFVYLGPCRGSVNDLPRGASSAASEVMGTRLNNDWGVALMAMIGVMISQDLGRVDPHTCEFAKAMAQVGFAE